jgi:hypothetical protein
MFDAQTTCGRSCLVRRFGRAENGSFSRHEDTIGGPDLASQRSRKGQAPLLKLLFTLTGLFLCEEGSRALGRRSLCGYCCAIFLRFSVAQGSRVQPPTPDRNGRCRLGVRTVLRHTLKGVRCIAKFHTYTAYGRCAQRLLGPFVVNNSRERINRPACASRWLTKVAVHQTIKVLPFLLGLLLRYKRTGGVLTPLGG